MVQKLHKYDCKHKINTSKKDSDNFTKLPATFLGENNNENQVKFAKFYNILLNNFFKALYGRIELDVCKSKTFQSSYFNRLVKLWNHVCKIAPSTTFASLSSFKRSLKAAYGNLVMTTFDVDLPCTWTLVRDCPCH